MKRILLLTHLNGQDNRGGAPYGVAGTTVEVEDSVADDAIARGFASAARDDSSPADPYAHLHINAIAARSAANSARTAAVKAATDADKAKADADAADQVASDAEAAADKAEHSAPYDAQASVNAQRDLDAFNAAHPDPLSAPDQATRGDLTARRDRAKVQPAPINPSPNPSPRSAAQQALADFNASHPDPLSAADQATKDSLIASASQ